MEDEIIHVLTLKESATQNATKFHGPHCRLSGSTLSTCQQDVQGVDISGFAAVADYSRFEIVVRQLNGRIR